MKFLRVGLLSLLFVLAAQISSVQASAGSTINSYSSNTSIPTTIAGFGMTGFGLSGLSGTTSSTGSPFGGTLNFADIGGAAVNMTRSTADTDSWWVNGETFDYDTYLISGLSWVEIILPENTRAFSFNVGANKSAQGWLTASSQTVGSAGTVTTAKDYFAVSGTNTPGFGVYADNKVGSCTTLTSVVIDPNFIWGFGNFSINQDACPTSVPESNSIYLLAIGLLGLLLVARRKV